MNKDIWAVLTSDEAVPFRIIEPLNPTFHVRHLPGTIGRHFSLCLQHANAGVALRTYRLRIAMAASRRQCAAIRSIRESRVERIVHTFLLQLGSETIVLIALRSAGDVISPVPSRN